MLINEHNLLVVSGLIYIQINELVRTYGSRFALVCFAVREIQMFLHSTCRTVDLHRSQLDLAIFGPPSCGSVDVSSWHTG